MEEARRHERVRVDRVARVRTASGMVIEARMADLSLGGAGFVYGAPAEVGTLVEMSFALPIRGELRPFALKGVVRYSHLSGNGYRVGVQFLDTPQEDLRALLIFTMQTKIIRR